MDNKNIVAIDHYMMPWGKYQGEFVADIVIEDPQYCNWLLEVCKDESIRDVLKYHIERRTDGSTN